MAIPAWHFRKIGTTRTWRSIVLQPRRTGKVFRLASISRLSDFKVMMSLYFFTGIFFTLSLNAFFTQLANDFVAGVLSIVGGVISSVVVAWCKRRWEQHWCGWSGRDFCHSLSFITQLRCAMNFVSFMVWVEPLTVEFVSNTGIFSSVLLYNFYLLLSMFFNILTPFFWITGTFIDT